MSWSLKDIKKKGLAAVGASQTDFAVSEPFVLSRDMASNSLVIKCVASGHSGTVTLKLQSGIDGTYTDSKTVSISGNGAFYIKLHAGVSGDASSYLPLLNTGRLVITTAAASGVTVDSLQVLG